MTIRPRAHSTRSKCASGQARLSPPMRRKLRGGSSSGGVRCCAALDRWFEQHGLRPRVAGEFEDSALMALFAARGLGVFPVSWWS